MDERNKLTPKLIQQLLMDENERLARQAEKDNNYEAAKVFWQFSQIEAKRFHKKTRARIAYPRSIKNEKNKQT